jgi:hypothetical protein
MAPQGNGYGTNGGYPLSYLAGIEWLSGDHLGKALPIGQCCRPVDYSVKGLKCDKGKRFRQNREASIAYSRRS